jgi:uncharacterized protein YjbJ (UPF0337 family)
LAKVDVKGGGALGAAQRMAGKITGDPVLEARGREREVNVLLECIL